MKRLFLSAFFVYLTLNIFAQHPDQIDVSNFVTSDFTDTINGMTIKGQVMNSRKEGIWTVSYNTGVISLLVQYKEGLKNGIVLELDRNGVLLSQTYFYNDTLNGTRLVFLGGGHPQLDEPYKMGKLHGTRRVFYERGKLQEASDYVDGQKNGKSIWYDEDGKMLAEYNYVNGLFEGSQLVFYPNGNIRSEQWYDQNRLHGKNIQFFENGNKKSSGNYKYGHKAGIWTLYDATGKEVEVQNFGE